MSCELVQNYEMKEKKWIFWLFQIQEFFLKNSIPSPDDESTIKSVVVSPITQSSFLSGLNWHCFFVKKIQ